jgi:sugar porter (SP) family MFS transporter
MRPRKPTLGEVRSNFFGLFVCTAGFLFGYDTGIVGGVLILDSFKNDFGINADNKTKISSLIVALQQAGAFVAALGCAPIADKLGRKKSIMLAMVIFVVGVIMEVVPSHSLALFYVGRVIAGLGLGSATAIVPQFNAEMAPKEIRGRVGSGMQWLFVWGVLLSYWVDYGVKVGMPSASRQWQIPVGLQAVPAGILGFGLLTQKESVRWLVKKNKLEEAWKSLTWIRASDSADVKAEFEEIKLGVHEEVIASQGRKKRELFEPANRYRLGLAFGVFLGQQNTGATALAYFGPQFFSLLAGGNATQALLVTGLFGVIKVISTGTFLIFFSDRLGRKPVLFVSAILMAVCMFIVSIINKTVPPPAGGATPAGIGTVAMIFLTIFIYCFSWGPLPWVYVSEVRVASMLKSDEQ